MAISSGGAAIMFLAGGPCNVILNLNLSRTNEKLKIKKLNFMEFEKNVRSENTNVMQHKHQRFL
jgi:hypothetical protein